MARIILHKAQAPVEVIVGKESTWMCRCGLSTTQPFCNGNHKKTIGEEEGKLYSYDENLTRTTVSER